MVPSAKRVLLWRAPPLARDLQGASFPLAVASFLGAWAFRVVVAWAFHAEVASFPWVAYPDAFLEEAFLVGAFLEEACLYLSNCTPYVCVLT